MPLSRRRFLAASAHTLIPAPASAIEPIPRNGKPHLRLSLAAYSFRKYLDVKKPTMTLEGFADLAASLGVDAIEPTSYYFKGTSPAYLAKLKGHCTRLGLDVSGTAIGNDFCWPDSARLNAQLALTRQWVERCAMLGGKTVRIFAGSVKKGDTLEKARDRCVAAIEEACEHAGKHGIFLALENHGGITATADNLLALVKPVKSPWFGVNLDTGNFHTPDPYADLAKIAPYAVVVQLKTEVVPAGKKKQDADLKRLIDILRAANYRGYVALEYEAAEEPKTGVPRAIAALQKLV
jgi:sugar phosphate isomerase/epimerase